MRVKITRKMVDGFLRKTDVHVHIKDDKGNPWQTILGIKLDNGFVISRTFISRRDKPNRQVANMVAVGRLMRGCDRGLVNGAFTLETVEKWLKEVVMINNGKYVIFRKDHIDQNGHLIKVLKVSNGVDVQSIIDLIHDFKRECESQLKDNPE